MNSDLQLTDEQLATVRHILQTQLPQTPVWAYGSRTKGKAGRYSDLDLAVITDKPLTFLQLAELDDAFSQSDLPWKVDILDWAAASDTFKQIVLQHYVVIQ